MKKIEQLREDINKMVLDNSLGDEEVISKSKIMDEHLNKYQKLINSKETQCELEEMKIKEKKNCYYEVLNSDARETNNKELERDLVESTECHIDIERFLSEESKKNPNNSIKNTNFEYDEVEINKDLEIEGFVCKNKDIKKLKRSLKNR
ncbi:MAG: aspartyl-phosphate phosphatase Spo0E family protein [Clostridiales bacterium]